MKSRPLRFLHAADFRLDTPCYGVTDLPEVLRDPFVEARYVAAERVFDAAIDREVDFVVLAGGLLDAELPGLRGPLFLIEQFQRLASLDIPVYWAGATFETGDRWPTHADVPGNLHCLTSSQASYTHLREGSPVAQVITIAGSEPPAADGGLLTVCVTRQSLSEMPRDCPLTGGSVDYWAWGGQPQRETTSWDRVPAHWPGSPQGRAPLEVGPHGCSLVTIDARGETDIEPITTDVVRWHHECVSVDRLTTWEDVRCLFDDRLRRLQDSLQSETSVSMAMVQWTVNGSGLSIQRLLQDRFQQEVAGCLNAHFIGRQPALWTLGMNVLVDEQQLCRWQDELSPLGDFLRTLNELSHLSATAERQSPEPSKSLDANMLQQVIKEGVHRLGTGLIDT